MCKRRAKFKKKINGHKGGGEREMFSLPERGKKKAQVKITTRWGGERVGEGVYNKKTEHVENKLGEATKTRGGGGV